MPWLRRPVVLSTPRRAWVPVLKVLAAFAGPLLVVLALAWLARGAYHTPGRPQLILKLGGALAAGALAIWLLSQVPSRRDGPLARLLMNFVLGAFLGYLTVSLSLDLLARLTAMQARTERVRYEVTGGWKNCRYGVAFDDGALQARLTLCGSRVGVPREPATGTLRLTETVGPYGIILHDVTVETRR